MLKYFIQAIILSIIFTFLLGFAYPEITTLIAQKLFTSKAGGSLITKNDEIIGSELIGQNFSDPKYFWGRVSKTSPYPYNAAGSSGSNLSPASTDLLASVKERVANLKKFDPNNTKKIPIDLVTSSASGLDPHISPEAAEYQVDRIASIRKINKEKLLLLIKEYTKDRQFGILGEPTVNVLMLNLALDKDKP